MTDAPDHPVDPSLSRTMLAGIVIGAANALGLLGFEWVVDHLQSSRSRSRAASCCRSPSG